MPVVCPKCSRLNADAAAKCIYCSSSLEGAAKFEAPDETKKLAERFLAERGATPRAKQDDSKKKPASHRVHHETERNKIPLKVIKGGKKPPVDLQTIRVVVAPTKEIPDDVVCRVAELLKKEPYLIRNKLAPGTPWVVRRFSEIGAAKELASNLLAAGLDAYSLTNEDFNDVPARLKAIKVSLISGGLRFDGASDDEPVVVKWTEAFLLVCGTIRRKPPAHTGKKRTKVSGKIAAEMKTYELMDIFPPKGRGVRVAEGIADFSGLGKYMLSSSLLNLRWVQNGYESGSSPIVDKGYRLQSMLFRLPLQHIGAILRHGKTTNKEPVYLDNSRHFDEYSTLAYLHYRKLSGE